ncbi:MAG: CPBP family intramembrane glutamic endopeptidase [Christensenellales bacterium]|jgi:membrane protease YdiL (CAAX protease family)
MKKIYQRSIYTKNDAALAFFLALLLPSVFLINFILIFYPGFFTGQAALSNASIFIKIIATIISQVAFAFIFFIMNKTLRVDYKKANKISFKLSARNILLSVLIGLIMLFGLNPLINMIDIGIAKLGHEPSTLPLSLDTVGWLLLNIVFMAILPAIFEEFLFRGIIFNGLKQYGKKAAIVLSAVLFMLVHGSIDQTVYPLLFGFVLALIAYRSNNIVNSIVAHFINNATVLTINFFALKTNFNIDFLYFKPTLLNIFLSILIAAITITLAFFLTKLYKKENTNYDFTQDEKSMLAETLLQEDKSDSEILDNLSQKQWEYLYTQKYNVRALEASAQKKNMLLWVSIGISIILWIISI